MAASETETTAARRASMLAKQDREWEEAAPFKNSFVVARSWIRGFRRTRIGRLASRVSVGSAQQHERRHSVCSLAHSTGLPVRMERV